MSTEFISGVEAEVSHSSRPEQVLHMAALGGKLALGAGRAVMSAVPHVPGVIDLRPPHLRALEARQQREAKLLAAQMMEY